MKSCPVCQTPLTHEKYEGFPVLHCGQCGGHLVPFRRLEPIKRLQRTTEAELKQEANAFSGDSTERIRCPRCNVYMRKEALDVPLIEGLHQDVCDHCQVVWFDGGELAMVQLVYEQTGEFRNVDELRQRMRELEADPERKAAFERTLAELPDSTFTLENAMGEGGALFLGLLGGLARPRRQHMLDWLADD